MGKHFRQKFNKKSYTYRTCVSNILGVLTLATAEEVQEGLDWYKKARDFANYLAQTYSTGCTFHYHSYVKACGVIAALSPQKSWEENMRIAEKFYETGEVEHTHVMRKKCFEILASSGSAESICDILSGNKITNFFLNILFEVDQKAVTIDRHALDIATGEVQDTKQMNGNQYEFFANCYRIAASRTIYTPSQLQAITWVVWRKLKKSSKNGQK